MLNYNGRNDPTYKLLVQCSSLYNPINVTDLHMVASIIIFAMAALFIVTANVVLVYGLMKKKVWRLRSTRFFLFLIWSDLLVGFVTVPLVIGIFTATALFDNCNYVHVTNVMLEFPSLLSATTVLLIAADRFFAIKKKRLHVRYATTRVFVFLIVANIFCSLPLSFITYYLLNDYNTGQAIALIFLGMYKSFIFVSITTIYHVVWKFVNTTAKRTRKSFCSTDSSTPPQYDHSIHRMTLFVSISLVTCYLPSTIANFYAAFCKLTNQEHLVKFYYIETWTVLPMYINSGLNGVLFICRNKRIRKWFLKVFLKFPSKFRRSKMMSPVKRERRDAIVIDTETHRNLAKLVVAIECSSL